MCYMIRKQNLFVGGDGYFETGDNINGQAEFTVYPDHPNYEYVKKLTTDVVFYNDGVPEFYGRILYDDEDDFSGAKKCSARENLHFSVTVYSQSKSIRISRCHNTSKT